LLVPENPVQAARGRLEVLMAVRSEKDVILEHAFCNEDNLQIALMIGVMYEDLCGRVVVSFLAWKRCQES
jgi:hypothetical protein